MATLFVRHRVDDYVRWKQVYDEFSAYRKANGFTGSAIFRDPEDPNNLTVIHHFVDMDAAKAFVTTMELGSAGARAGVNSGPSEMWFAEEVESSSL